MFHKILTLAASVFLSAATAFSNQPVSVDVDSLLPGSHGEDILRDYQPDFPARGGDVDWGLALSGGGLRSAAFSIGSMKALYDLGLLDDIDVISSVSGGGYASYWLYSRFGGDNDLAFGEAAFRDDLYPRNVCTLASKSEFFPLRRMIASVFSSRDAAFRKYRDSIEWSFGADGWKSRKEIHDAGESGMRPLRYLLPSVTAARAPFYIINTTIKNDRGRNGKPLQKIEKTFEIGPTYRGSTALGFAKWNSDDTGIGAWSSATAISGAGIRFKLSRKIADYDEPNDPDRIDLADGGLSENLAALPLITRGVKNIIVVDAENDPGYKFGSYCGLREYLRERHIKLKIETIDNFVDCKTKKRKRDERIFTAASVSEGTVVSEPGYLGKAIDAKIYYVKMSRPAKFFSQAAIDGAANSPDYLDYKRKVRPDDCPSGQLRPIRYSTMLQDVLSYAHYLNGDWRWGGFFEFLPYINYNFPQITTVDQTFYGKQLEAFIGLGYLEMCEMQPFSGTGKSCTENR